MNGISKKRPQSLTHKNTENQHVVDIAKFPGGK